MKAKILVADDDLLYRTLFSTSLEESGFEVRCVSDGAEALAAIEDGAFDLVLLDLLMPVMDGFSTLTALRNKKAPPVIVISATDEQESISRCFDLGAIDALPKPFEPAMLQSRVRSVLARALYSKLSSRAQEAAKILSSLLLSGSISQPDREKISNALDLLA